MATHKAMTIDTLLGREPNRIERAVGMIEEKLTTIGKEKADGLAAKLELTFQEFTAFQNAQALAHASGKLTLDEAQIVYSALGGESYQDGWPADTSLALRIVVTQLMGELLKP